MSTAGLRPKTYLGVLIGTLPESGVEETLASDLLTVVNEPPDCSLALADPDSVWPPNRRMVAVTVDGIIDPDGVSKLFVILGRFIYPQ